MSKKATSPQANIFTIFIVIVGLLVIGMVVFVNQQEPPEADDVLPQGGSPENEADISQLLENSNNAPDNVDSTDTVASNNPGNTNTTEVAIVPDTSTDDTGTVILPNTTELTLLQEASVTSQGEIQTYQFGNGNVVNVMSPEFKSLILNEAAVVRKESITIGSQTGEKITVESAKDGSEIKIIQIVTGTTLYDIRGSEEFINNITNYINF